MAASHTLLGLVEYVRQFVAESLPGCSPCELTIVIRDVKGEEKPFWLPLAGVPLALYQTPLPEPGHQPAAPVEPSELAERKGPMLHRCKREILATLRDYGKPLTKTRLLEEMGLRRYEWSESTVTTHLHDLMEDGTLCNPADAKPRGYRIAAD